MEKKKLNRRNIGLENRLPIKVLQFGEGNFLRAFTGYIFQQLNKRVDYNAGIAVVQPIEKGLVDILNKQDGLYTLFMKGFKKGNEIQEIELISNIVKVVNPYSSFNDYLNLAKEDSLEFVISNTTEAGITYISSDKPNMQPPSSFPAKLTVLLHERFKHFSGNKNKGLIIIPCELINHNSEVLKEIILKYVEDWNLGEDFKIWLLGSNSFHSTLVDKIVPGYPKDQIDFYNAQLDYEDDLIVVAETFLLWVIEGGDDLRAKLPFDKTNLDVKIVSDMQPYRTRKVRILNGAHTALVPFSILYGHKTVEQSIDNSFTGKFIREAVFNEIIDTLDMEKEELNSFADEVFDRFKNPFIVHQLSSIALNSISKFKVRVLPSILGYINIHHKLPINLTFAFAALIRFYKGDWNGANLPVNDNSEIIAIFNTIWKYNSYLEIAKNILIIEEFWGEDLTKVENLTEAIALALEEIEVHGIEKGFTYYKKSFK